MRENMGLYRGKEKPNGEWVEGFLVDAQHIGNWVEAHPVDPETVGQFTGVYDSTKWEDLTPEEQEAFLHQPDGWKNTPDLWHGKQVFEGDIFKTKISIGVIRYREDQVTFGFEIWWNGFPDDFATFMDLGKPEFVIIGNIHDNPELLNPDHPEVVEVSK